MERASRGAVTFVFTDIEGSTRLLHDLGDEAYARALTDHHRVVRDEFTARGGSELTNQGDGFLFVFERAPDAVTAAARTQQALESGPVHVRMGIHTGQVRTTTDGYVGLDLHKGARIMAAAHGGQILLSRATRDQIDAEVLDLGEHRLKDFSEPEELFQLGRSPFPPLKTISNTNLPRPASSFVGRNREIAEVVGLLRGDARLVTLTGPGGAGKTRLALEAAGELVAGYPAGVFWVGLAAVKDPSLVLGTVAETLGASDGLASYIGDRELLLVLDNFEQVVQAAAEVSDLLRTCPNLALLITSRERLRIDGEIDYRVPPLREDEAVELFCARARLEPDEVVASLCRRLDDLPLALELAAARTSVLSPSQILERLSERLDLFHGGRDADSRQQTLRGAIEWSYALLEPDERELFARLSVFADGCTLPAAEEVCAAKLETLESLVAKNLAQHGAERFAMLETIREYAHERLTARGEAELMTRRLAERLCRLGEVFAAERRSGLASSIAQLELELENIRVVIRATLDWIDDPLALRLTTALSWFWRSSGRCKEGVRWITEALERRTNVPVTERAEALHQAAVLATLAADSERGRTLGQEALTLHRSAGDEHRAAEILSWLAHAHLAGGDTVRARALHAESILLQEQLGVPVDSARARRVAAEDELEIGDYLRATELFDEALTVAREAGIESEIVMTLHGLGDVALVSGDAPTAARFYCEALEYTTESTPAANCLAGLAAAAALMRRVELAGQIWGAVQSHQQRHGEQLIYPSTVRRYETALEEVQGAEFSAAAIIGHELTLEEASQQAFEGLRR